MKDGGVPSSSSASAGGPVDAAAAAAAVSTAVGPLRVMGSTSKDKLKLAPPNLISSRGVHHRSDDSDDSDDERPLGRGRARARARGRRELGESHEDDSDDDDDSDTDDSHDGGVGGRGRGSGVVMSDDEGGVGGKGAHGDVDAPGLGSFSTMGAVIGDFSPQFKFSFTDDIHLDLGGGLKVGAGAILCNTCKCLLLECTCILPAVVYLLCTTTGFGSTAARWVYRVGLG